MYYDRTKYDTNFRKNIFVVRTCVLSVIIAVIIKQYAHNYIMAVIYKPVDCNMYIK